MGNHRARNRERIEAYIFARSLAEKRSAAGDIPDEGKAGKTRREGSPPMSISYLEKQMDERRADAFATLVHITEYRLPEEDPALAAVYEAVAADWGFVRSWKAGRTVHDRESLALYNRLLSAIESMLPEDSRLPDMGPSPSDSLLHHHNQVQSERAQKVYNRIGKAYTEARKRGEGVAAAKKRAAEAEGVGKDSVRRALTYLQIEA